MGSLHLLPRNGMSMVVKIMLLPLLLSHIYYYIATYQMLPENIKLIIITYGLRYNKL